MLHHIAEIIGLFAVGFVVFGTGWAAAIHYHTQTDEERAAATRRSYYGL